MGDDVVAATNAATTNPAVCAAAVAIGRDQMGKEEEPFRVQGALLEAPLSP